MFLLPLRLWLHGFSSVLLLVVLLLFCSWSGNSSVVVVHGATAIAENDNVDIIRSNNKNTAWIGIQSGTTSRSNTIDDGSSSSSSSSSSTSSYAGGIIVYKDMVYLTGATYGDVSFFDDVIVDAQQQDHSLNDGSSGRATSRPTRTRSRSTAASGDDDENNTPFFCFVAAISISEWLSSTLSSNSSNATATTTTIWKQRQQFQPSGTSDSQACLTLTYRPSKTTPQRPELYLAGYSQSQRRQQESSSSPPSRVVDASGIIYDSISTAPPNYVNLQERAVVGKQQQSSDSLLVLQYPVAIVAVTNETTDTILFVANIVSSNPIPIASQSDFNVSYIQHDDSVDPTNLDDLIHAFGTNYSLNVQKLVQRTNTTQNNNNNNITSQYTTEWSQTYSTHYGESVHVSSMLFVTKPFDGGVNDDVDMIIVAGYTTGFGLAFGANAQSIDYDGFVTKFLAKNGTLPYPNDEQGPPPDPNTTKFQFGATYSKRIYSQSGQHDLIMGLCQQPESAVTVTSSSSSTNHYIYAVGTTQGIIAGSQQSGGGAFLLQLDIETLQTKWAQQISGSNIQGIACAVTPDGQHVYLAGNAPHGSDLVDAHRTQQRNRKQQQQQVLPYNTDIFVAQLDTYNGTLIWTQWIGTPDANERLAQGNTGGLDVDAQGNLYVYGNTQGSLFRDTTIPSNNTSAQQEHRVTNDIFLAFLSRNYTPPLAATTTSTNGGGSNIENTFQHRFRKINIAAFFIVVAIVVAVLVGLYAACQRRRRRRHHNLAGLYTTKQQEQQQQRYELQSLDLVVEGSSAAASAAASAAPAPSLSTTTATLNNNNTQMRNNDNDHDAHDELL